eukprot:GSChrysophyteH1.ASY1.ANO1.344.1 assembled CDS
MIASAEEERFADAPNFYDWREVYPEELQDLHSNVAKVAAEAKVMAQKPWIPWPEDVLSGGSGNESNWTVFPFLHTFPALDDSRSQWVGSTCKQCPYTVSLLKKIPNIRTALFSRMSGGTDLMEHTGWCDLANYVLRVHICLDIPTDKESCGLVVDGEVEHHKQGEILIFADSKSHKAFNNSEEERIVLIVDILRPVDIPLGTCVGGHTSQLNGLINMFA